MSKHGSNAFFEAVRVALGSLRASKLRSFLTLLGIILATTTLIGNVFRATFLRSMGGRCIRTRALRLFAHDPAEGVLLELDVFRIP